MAMTMTEADAVSRLIRFVLAGEQYTGQAERNNAGTPTLQAARDLEYLRTRASKVLGISISGDTEVYADRLSPLAAGNSLLDEQPSPSTTDAPQADRTSSIEQMRYAEWCKGNAAEASAARLVGLKEIDEVHIEWGGTDLDDVNQLDLWERIGRALRKAGV